MATTTENYEVLKIFAFLSFNSGDMPALQKLSILLAKPNFDMKVKEIETARDKFNKYL